MKCNEFVALLRVNALWKHLFSELFRWLAGKTSMLREWSLYKMSEVLDLCSRAGDDGDCRGPVAHTRLWARLLCIGRR